MLRTIRRALIRIAGPNQAMSGVMKQDQRHITLSCAGCEYTEDRVIDKPFDEAVSSAVEFAKRLLRVKSEDRVVYGIGYRVTRPAEGTAMRRCTLCFRLYCGKCWTWRCPYCGEKEGMDALEFVVRRELRAKLKETDTNPE